MTGNAFNIAVSGQKQGEYVMSTIGWYDYWAIEYAYKQIPAERKRTNCRGSPCAATSRSSHL
jgi:hypothetical protein